MSYAQKEREILNEAIKKDKLCQISVLVQQLYGLSFNDSCLVYKRLLDMTEDELREQFKGFVPDYIKKV
jgi:hypothetical protein